MKECLSEEVLQSYLDGEVHGERVEQVTSHLTSCLRCGDLARQLEQENSVLAIALAPEFESAVPSERLRQRLDAAIASARIEAAGSNAPAANVRNWLTSLSDLFTFRPQRAVAYASLMMIIGFGLIMAMMRWQTEITPQPISVAINPPVTPATNQGTTKTTSGNSSVAPPEAAGTGTAIGFVPNNRPRTRVNVAAPSPAAANHVKLLPGERSYLQTIAQLDTTIKADKSRMKPGVEA